MNREIIDKLKTAAVTFLCATVIYIIIFQLVLLPRLKSGENDTSLNQKLAQIQSVIDENSIYEFDSSFAYNNSCRGYIGGLTDDRYVSYYSKEDYETYISENEGNFSGLGLEMLNQTSGTLTDGLFIRRVTGNSPAETAGIKGGDYIISVNGVSVIGKTYREASALLAGEIGTNFKITVNRKTGDNINESLSFDITRQNFVKRLVDFSVVDSDIGYIYIHEFDRSVSSEFKNALTSLLSYNVKGFIFDLRDNPGGDLYTVREMLDYLLPKGEEIATIEYKDRQEKLYSELEPITDLPFTVLINSRSASGSEMFSSALRDNLGVKLIGEKSYGKGIGQTSYKFSDGSGMVLTTFKYYTKSHTDFNGIGLEPDYQVGLSDEKYKLLYTLDKNDDEQFVKAKEIIRQTIFEKGN